MNNDDTIIKTDDATVEVQATEEATVKAEEVAAEEAEMATEEGTGEEVSAE